MVRFEDWGESEEKDKWQVTNDNGQNDRRESEEKGIKNNGRTNDKTNDRGKKKKRTEDKCDDGDRPSGAEIVTSKGLLGAE